MTRAARWLLLTRAAPCCSRSHSPLLIDRALAPPSPLLLFINNSSLNNSQPGKRTHHEWAVLDEHGNAELQNSANVQRHRFRLFFLFFVADVLSVFFFVFVLSCSVVISDKKVSGTELKS